MGDIDAGAERRERDEKYNKGRGRKVKVRMRTRTGMIGQEQERRTLNDEIQAFLSPLLLLFIFIFFLDDGGSRTPPR